MTSSEALGPKPRYLFLRARLGSFLAFMPLGVWTVGHVWSQLAAFRGPAAWEAAVIEYEHPVSQFVTSVIVLLPLFIHTLWGIQRLTTSRPNNLHYGYYANVKYLLQRVSAVGVLLFVGAHLWLAWLHPRLTTGRGEPFSDISAEMRFHLPTLIVYVLGTLGVSYHLGNGLQTMLMGWGVVTSQRGLRRLEWFGIAVFVVMLAMSWTAIYALWRAGYDAA